MRSQEKKGLCARSAERLGRAGCLRSSSARYAGTERRRFSREANSDSRSFGCTDSGGDYLIFRIRTSFDLLVQFRSAAISSFFAY